MLSWYAQWNVGHLIRKGELDKNALEFFSPFFIVPTTHPSE